MMRPLAPRPMIWTRISERAGADDPAAVRAKALELLARREHSRLELRQKLIQRGFSTDRIESALDQLTEEHWLDEARFAELYACGRADKGYGPLRIGRELRERGVSQDLVDTVLAGLENDWLPTAPQALPVPRAHRYGGANATNAGAASTRFYPGADQAFFARLGGQEIPLSLAL